MRGLHCWYAWPHLLIYFLKWRSLESEYHLSTELTGHSGDVRAVVDLQTDEGQSVYVVTTSRDKTARVWLREDQREYKTVRILQQHKGFVTCACVSVVHAGIESGRDKVRMITGSGTVYW